MPKERMGYCRICGEYKKLSFEHIPPRSAFNYHQRLFQTMQNLLEGRGYTKFPRGVGNYSLCESCNNLTGSWYGDDFVRWAKQGFEWSEKLAGESLLRLPYYIRPLNVLKQILVMALAMSPEQTLNYHYDLRCFLLSKRQRNLPGRYRVHTYFPIAGNPRYASAMPVARIDIGSGSFVEAEIALQPFGYCVTTPVPGMKSLADAQGLSDITWFSNYSYNEWSCVHLAIPLRETHEALPLDYRTKSEIEQHKERLGIQ